MPDQANRELHAVHLTTVHSPTDVRIFRKECRSLRRAGYRVTLVATHGENQIIDGVHIVALARPRNRAWRMLSTTWQMYRRAVKLDGELYHFHDPELIPVGLLLRARGKRVIYDIHEDVPRQVSCKLYLPAWLRGPVAWLVERVESLAGPHFSALVAATPTIAARHRRYNRRTVVVHNYPLLSELAAAGETPWDGRPNDVAYVGGIAPERGSEQMVRAMALLPDALGATLRLAGRFTRPGERAQVECLPGWQRVQALGFLDRAAVARLLGTVRAGLVLLAPLPHHQVALPTKMFEYMAAGLPVVVSDFALWREIVQDARCGLLVDPLDAQAIADAIRWLLTHPSQAEAMGQRGRQMVLERYNWAPEERRLVQLYGTLLAAPAADASPERVSA